MTKKLSQHLTQNSALSRVQPPPYGSTLMSAHPPVSSLLSEPLTKRNKRFEGLMSPQSEAAPPESRLPEPPLSPEIPGKDSFLLKLITVLNISHNENPLLQKKWVHFSFWGSPKVKSISATIKYELLFSPDSIKNDALNDAS